MILALLAGVQTRLMPMAMASPGTDMAGMASHGGSHDCKGCVPLKMTVRDCGAVCAMMVAVVDGMQAFSIIVRCSGWAWSNEPLQLHSPKPDTAPPRF